MFEVRNFLNNAQSFAWSTFTIFQKKIAHSTNTVTQTIYIILLVRNFLNNAQNFTLSIYTQLKKKIEEELRIHQTYSKNLHNFVSLKYAMFKKMLKITHAQHTHYF